MNNYYYIQNIQQREFQAYKEKLEALKKTIECAEKYDELTYEMKQALISGDVNICHSVLQKEICKYRNFIMANETFLGFKVTEYNTEQNKAHELLYYRQQFKIISYVILCKITCDAARETFIEKVIEESLGN